jgi:hypothetical protein
MDLYKVDFTTRDAIDGTPTNRTYYAGANTLAEVQSHIMNRYGTDYTIKTYTVKVMEGNSMSTNKDKLAVCMGAMVFAVPLILIVLAAAFG